MPVTEEELLNMVRSSMDGEYERCSIDPFAAAYPDLTEDEAYTGQELRLKRMEEQGGRLVGYKLGGTSLAKLRQLKDDIYTSAQAAIPLRTVIYGRLMDYMRLSPQEGLRLSELLHPKVEAELAFIMETELSGGSVSAADVLEATAYVAPAFEIIDSRFRDFKIGRRLDAVIDNVSAARFKLGEGRRRPEEIDLCSMGMKLRRNGAYVGFGAGASVMGHPARAMAELVRALHGRGMGLRKGDIVLSGAISASTPIQPGDRFRADFDHLGHVELNAL